MLHLSLCLRRSKTTFEVTGASLGRHTLRSHQHDVVVDHFGLVYCYGCPALFDQTLILAFLDADDGPVSDRLLSGACLGGQVLVKAVSLVSYALL